MTAADILYHAVSLCCKSSCGVVLLGGESKVSGLRASGRERRTRSRQSGTLFIATRLLYCAFGAPCDVPRTFSNYTSIHMDSSALPAPPLCSKTSPVIISPLRRLAPPRGDQSLVNTSRRLKEDPRPTRHVPKPSRDTYSVSNSITRVGVL